MKRSLSPPGFTALVRDFFCDRLLNQQNVSPHTVASYRDAFRLLLDFLQRRHGTSPSKLSLDDFDAPTMLAFLDDLETGRGNSIRTRNARLVAIRAFIAYASARDPTALPLAQRVLAIPQKRFDRVDGGSKRWRGAAEFGGAGLLNVSVGSSVSRERLVGQSWAG